MISVRLLVFTIAIFAATIAWRQSSLLAPGDDEPQPRRRLMGEENWDLKDTLARHLPMFGLSDFTVLGPTSFPKPTDKAKTSSKDVIVPFLKPAFGTHRPDQDAVLLFAAEYPLATYVLFLSTLRGTGFDGDVVLALSVHDLENKEIADYLKDDPHVIAYTIEYTCFNAENEEVDSAKGGMRVCQAHSLYGRKADDGTVTPIRDPREPRTVPTTRYEIYWIWAQYYNDHSWLMLIDARDTVFQTNPFDHVPRDTSNRDSGVLFFFGVSCVLHYLMSCG